MLLSIAETIFYCFYPLEALDAKKRHTINDTQHKQTRRPSIPQSTRKTMTIKVPYHPKRALIVAEPPLQPGSTSSTRTKECRCPGCGMRFSRNCKSLRYRCKKHHRLCCACSKMFKLAKVDDLIQRFTQQKTQRDHESNFTQYLHIMREDFHSTSSKTDLYHLPLSTNYYRRLSQRRLVHHSSSPEDNTVSHFRACAGCRSFVSHRRKSLLRSTKQAKRKRNQETKNINRQVASTRDLFKIMVSSNASCAFSGSKGIWYSCSPNRTVPLYSLSLDHKIPLSKGGSSNIDNLQVSLVCLNSIKGSHSNRKFIKWWKAFTKEQGCF